MIVRSGAVSEILTEYPSDKSYGMDLNQSFGRLPSSRGGGVDLGVTP